MKFNHLALTGGLIVPALGLALLTAAAGYWLSRRQSIEDNSDSSPNEEVQQTPVINNKVAKETKAKKKGKCGCGSEKSVIDRPVSLIKIFYGTLTGKSKVV